MVGLLLSILNYEYVIANTDAIDIEKDPDPMKLERNTNSFTVICRFTTFFTSMISVGCLYIRHRYQMKWANNYSAQIERSPNHISFMYDEIINMK